MIDKKKPNPKLKELADEIKAKDAPAVPVGDAPAVPVPAEKTENRGRPKKIAVKKELTEKEKEELEETLKFLMTMPFFAMGKLCQVCGVENKDIAEFEPNERMIKSARVILENSEKTLDNVTLNKYIFYGYYGSALLTASITTLGIVLGKVSGKKIEPAKEPDKKTDEEKKDVTK